MIVRRLLVFGKGVLVQFSSPGYELHVSESAGIGVGAGNVKGSEEF